MHLKRDNTDLKFTEQDLVLMALFYSAIGCVLVMGLLMILFL